MARVYHTTWLHGGDRSEKRDRVKKEMRKNHGMQRLGELWVRTEHSVMWGVFQ